MKTRLVDFEVRNYRSCVKSRFKPHDDLSVLIGANGSGKSNLLTAIQLLRAVVDGAGRQDQEEAETVSSISASFVWNDKIIKIRGRVFQRSRPRGNSQSVIRSQCKWNFGAITGDKRWIEMTSGLREWSKRLGRLRPKEFDVWEHRLRGQLGVDSKGLRMLAKFPECELARSEVVSFVSKIRYYGASQFTNPSSCPASIELEKGAVAYDPTPGRHKKFLIDMYGAYFRRKEEPFYDQFISIVGKKGLGLIDGIDFRVLSLPRSEYEVIVGGKFVKKTLPRALIIPRVKVDGFRLSLSQLSEGTFKTIALIFYLIIERGSLLLIEEPEVCVHHGLLKSIVELLKNHSLHRQIIVSTHSDFVLDILKPENVFIVEKQKKTGTIVRGISKTLSALDYKALKAYLGEAGTLGEYWKAGGLVPND